MRLLEIFRKYVFELLEFLKGGKIRKHYRNIALVLNNGSSEKASQQQKKDLSALLLHAVTTTSFYKEYNSYKSQNDFPVINKSIVLESYNRFISGIFSESELIPVVTSGSTGTPFRIFHDKNKRLRNKADTLFFAQKAGYRLGDRLVYFKVWNKQNKKSPINFWIENIIPIDVSRLNDENIEEFLNQIEHRKSTFDILGYASALELICQYLDKKNYGRVNAKVNSVIAMSETLNDYTKKSMQKYFNSKVVSRYSNLENGIIAQQETNDSKKYLINTASYIVEILKMDSDEPAEQGQTGRIVLTDLFNYGMPLIRYDTGDLGSLSLESGEAGNMYLANVEGRKMDMLYDTNGNLVSSFPIQYLCEEYSDIIQYQLIQENQREYTLKLNTKKDASLDEVALKDKLRKVLGQDAMIAIEYVFEIPLLSSGKRKIVVNNYMLVP